MMGMMDFLKQVVDFAKRVEVPKDVMAFAITGRHVAPGQRVYNDVRRPEVASRSSYQPRRHQRGTHSLNEDLLLTEWHEALEETLGGISDRNELKLMADDFISQHLDANDVLHSPYADYYRSLLMSDLEDRDFYYCYFRSRNLADACDCGNEDCNFSEAYAA